VTLLSLAWYTWGPHAAAPPPLLWDTLEVGTERVPFVDDPLTITDFVRRSRQHLLAEALGVDVEIEVVAVR